MDIFKKRFFSTPWALIRFFLPLVMLIPAGVYYLTLFKHVYPGLPAFLTALSADLTKQSDLANPLFTLIIHAVAKIPFATLPVRLNLICAVFGSSAVALFYLFTARLIFICACEDPGGAMAALPPRTRDDDFSGKQQPFALNADGSISIPPSVQTHNWRVAYAAVLGGLGAALTLAFCGPFWLAATRLYPYTFDLALFFLLVNLLISYDQRAGFFSLFFSSFLLTACSVESPLFLVLLPIGGIFLLRAQILNDQAKLYKMLFVVLAGLAGCIIAITLLWQASAWTASIPIPAPRPILRVFSQTVLRELIRWIPSFGWSYVFVQLLFPVSISLFVFSYSFRKRTPGLFFLQLVLIAMLIPSLLNLNISPWAIARLTSRIPIFGYTAIALLTGLTIAVWHLMREISNEQIDEDLDYYEYRDNPWVCRIGAALCWPLLALVLIVPFRSFTDIDPKDGTFVDEIVDGIYRELGPRDWLVNCHTIHHHLMIRAFQDGRNLHFISTDDEDDTHHHSQDLAALIQTQPDFAPYRDRLLNAADLSTTSFLNEWLKHETNAYQRIVLFDTAALWRENGFQAIPTGLFISGRPNTSPPDCGEILTNHLAFVDALKPAYSPVAPDRIRYFATLRASLRQQLARMANELAFLLTANHREHDAALLLEQTQALDPQNLSVLLNLYHLTANLQVQRETRPSLEPRLRAIPQQLDTLTLTPSLVQTRGGTLINPDVLEHVRRKFWDREITFRNLAVPSQKDVSASFTALRDKKREFYQIISAYIDAYDYEDADRQLNLLLDLDDKDSFALINKARIAIERHNPSEAGLWMDLAKENHVPADRLIWHEASLLILDNQLPDAKKLINQAIPNAPSDIGLWGLLADILLREGNYPELENRVYPALRSATSKKDHYLLYLVRGYILKQNGPREYPAARIAFRQALALNKNLTAVREELLRLDDALNVPAFSEEDAKSVLRMNPDHAFANYLLGMVRFQRNQLDLATDLFKRSLEHTRNAPAYAGLGAVMLQKGEYELAEKLLRRSLEMDKTRLFTWHQLARLYLATDKTSEAESALTPVLKQSREDPEVQITLIELYLKQQKLEAAATLASELLEMQNQLPASIIRQLNPLVAQLTKALSR